MDLLESDSARPRQARYQAALRPDNNCILIMDHLRGLVLLQQANLTLNCAKTRFLIDRCAGIIGRAPNDWGENQNAFLALLPLTHSRGSKDAKQGTGGERLARPGRSGPRA